MDIINLKSQIVSVVDIQRQELCDLSRKIHDNPETGFHEYKAAGWLTGFLENNGFSVERCFSGLETAFRAAYGQGNPVIALLAEYDALSKLGHGCGHNIIAASAAGAGIGAKLAVDQCGGTVIVIGTPAEEVSGGKVIMARRGAFTGLDAALMVHPARHDVIITSALACQSINVEFFGKASHAAARPQSGINALEAMLQSFAAINALRQHIKPKSFVHGIITDGGQAPNVIPDHSSGIFMVRADDEAGLTEIKQRVLQCFAGAALATGARLEYHWEEEWHAPVLNNLVMGRLFMQNMHYLGRMTRFSNPHLSFGSTDFGNVSQIIPGIHPSISITTTRGVAAHTPQFADASASETGMQAMLDGAKALSMTVADLLCVPENLSRVKQEFSRRQRNITRIT